MLVPVLALVAAACNGVDGGRVDVVAAPQRHFLSNAQGAISNLLGMLQICTSSVAYGGFCSCSHATLWNTEQLNKLNRVEADILRHLLSPRKARLLEAAGNGRAPRWSRRLAGGCWACHPRTAACLEDSSRCIWPRVCSCGFRTQDSEESGGRVPGLHDSPLLLRSFLGARNMVLPKIRLCKSRCCN